MTTASDLQPASPQGVTTRIQANIVRGLDPAAVLHLFFRIDDARLFRGLIATLLGPAPAAGTNGPTADQVRAAFADGTAARLILSDEEANRRASDGSRQRPDIALGLALSWSGLKALGLDPNTLASFPEDFRQGMAVRSLQLGDRGDSAPPNWDGWLGTAAIHGVLSIHARAASAAAAILSFDLTNTAPSGPGADPLGLYAMRARAKALGIELLQAETARKLERSDSNGERYGIEHFGFRDGISQPIANIGLEPPVAGGGTARPGGTWDPIALGELLLGHADEDGLVQQRPVVKKLRDDGTYMVFRKLEQDVIAFRRYLRQNDDRADQSSLLAARMMGRWPNGTSLAQSPTVPSATLPRDRLNDFRYQEADAAGARCPIASHARRVNPRDSNNRDEARRRRIWRRSLSYGPGFLPYAAEDDGRKRGMLFTALNARIDQQFEFLQSRWLNTGEFIGQAGLARCPITGANGGDLQDSFHVKDRPAPYTHLPRFVHTRGGEYFFVPSLAALAAMAAGETFPSAEDPPNPGMDKTPPVLDSDGLYALAADRLLGPGKPAALSLPGMTLVARHDLVKAILDDDVTYGVGDYDRRIRAATGDQSLIVGLPAGNAERDLRLKILGDAWRRLGTAQVGPIVAGAMRAILARFTNKGRIDAILDVSRVVPLVLARHYFGVAGPDWVSPSFIASLFNRQELSAVPPDWLTSLPHTPPQDVPTASLLAWVHTAFAQVFLNVVEARELTELSARTTAEMLRHLERTVAEGRRLGAPGTLLGELLALDPNTYQIDALRLDRITRLLLMELLVGSAGTLYEALPNLLVQLLDYPDRLAQAVALRGNDSALDGLIAEAMRFDPVAPVLFRRATRDTSVDTVAIPRGTLVALQLKAAMFDPLAFVRPKEFLLDPNQRPSDRYLHFGFGPHYCRGADIGVVVIREMLKPLLALPGLRRAALGPIRDRDGLQRPITLPLRFG